MIGRFANDCVGGPKHFMAACAWAGETWEALMRRSIYVNMGARHRNAALAAGSLCAGRCKSKSSLDLVTGGAVQQLASRAREGFIV
jgi:hypothetical protein